MDAASIKTDADTKTLDLSLHSRASSTTLCNKPDSDKIQPTQDSSHKNNNNNNSIGTPEKDFPRYLYFERTGVPNPNAQPKPKSKVSKFMSKFQSPAVKQTNAARERELLEQERRGVKIYTPLGTPGSATQATAAWFS